MGTGKKGEATILAQTGRANITLDKSAIRGKAAARVFNSFLDKARAATHRHYEGADRALITAGARGT